MLRKDGKARYFLCCYQNASGESVVLKVPRQQGDTVEQPIAPGEQLLFSATDDEMIEIYHHRGNARALMLELSSAELRYLPGEEA